VRYLILFFSVASLSLPLAAQVSETGGDTDDGAPRAQVVRPANDSDDGTGAPRAQSTGPGAVQDAEAAREKLLKASDQIDMMESNSEATKAAMDGIKTQLAKLESDNSALKLQVSTLQDAVQKQQDALDKMQADHAKERQALIDEISALVASKTAVHKPKHVDAEPAAASSSDDTETPPPAPKKKKAEPLAPPADATASGPTTPVADDTAVAAPAQKPAETATPHPRKGWIYVVKPHETLSLIVGAFRDQGVKVTVPEVRKANGLGATSTLKVGQKLFIPKPAA